MRRGGAGSGIGAGGGAGLSRKLQERAQQNHRKRGSGVGFLGYFVIFHLRQVLPGACRPSAPPTFILENKEAIIHLGPLLAAPCLGW